MATARRGGSSIVQVAGCPAAAAACAPLSTAVSAAASACSSPSSSSSPRPTSTAASPRSRRAMRTRGRRRCRGRRGAAAVELRGDACDPQVVRGSAVNDHIKVAPPRCPHATPGSLIGQTGRRSSNSDRSSSVRSSATRIAIDCVVAILVVELALPVMGGLPREAPRQCLPPGYPAAKAVAAALASAPRSGHIACVLHGKKFEVGHRTNGVDKACDARLAPLGSFRRGSARAGHAPPTRQGRPEAQRPGRDWRPPHGEKDRRHRGRRDTVQVVERRAAVAATRAHGTTTAGRAKRRRRIRPRWKYGTGSATASTASATASTATSTRSRCLARQRKAARRGAAAGPRLRECHGQEVVVPKVGAGIRVGLDRPQAEDGPVISDRRLVLQALGPDGHRQDVVAKAQLVPEARQERGAELGPGASAEAMHGHDAPEPVGLFCLVPHRLQHGPRPGERVLLRLLLRLRLIPNAGCPWRDHGPRRHVLHRTHEALGHLHVRVHNHTSGDCSAAMAGIVVGVLIPAAATTLMTIISGVVPVVKQGPAARCPGQAPPTAIGAGARSSAAAGAALDIVVVITTIIRVQQLVLRLRPEALSELDAALAKVDHDRRARRSHGGKLSLGPAATLNIFSCQFIFQFPVYQRFY